MRTVLLPKRVTKPASDAAELTEFITFPLEEVQSRFLAYLEANCGKKENIKEACEETFLTWQLLGPDEFWSAALEGYWGCDEAFIGQALCKRDAARQDAKNALLRLCHLQPLDVNMIHEILADTRIFSIKNNGRQKQR